MQFLKRLILALDRPDFRIFSSPTNYNTQYWIPIRILQRATLKILMEPETNRFAKNLATQYGNSSRFGLCRYLSKSLGKWFFLDPQANCFAKDLVICVGTGLTSIRLSRECDIRSVNMSNMTQYKKIYFVNSIHLDNIRYIFFREL